MPTPPAAATPPAAPARWLNESDVDYSIRIRRAQAAFVDATAKLDSGDFTGALTAFHSVERDQPDYPNLKLLIALTLKRQSQMVQNDLQTGLAHERAGKYKEARLSYLHALKSDVSSAEARDKAAAMRDLTNAQALRLLAQANVAEKLGDLTLAARLYEQVRDVTIDGDAQRIEAVQRLDTLKR
jgi:tetratricopeptide (TPR) repeat protein